MAIADRSTRAGFGAEPEALMGTTPLRLAVPALLGLCGLLAVVQPTAAQTVEQFYKGRTLELLTTAPGGRYDLTSRLVARHFGEFLPGRPKVIVQVEPDAGGLTVANRLANTSRGTDRCWRSRNRPPGSSPSRAIPVPASIPPG
jgi:hypothetical protein